MAEQHFRPAYLALLKGDQLQQRAEQAYEQMRNCDLCARYCHVDRYEGIKGAVCRTGVRAVVNSYGPHHGEEDPLRGSRGSGTIFFSWCSLRCVFCQNWEISQKGMGDEVEPEELAQMMLSLQAQGCHNINFVTPSHVVAQLIAAVDIAARHGLRIPLVYNSGGYDSPEALKLLDGIIDIYMPDMKYGDSAIARKYSKVRDYVEVNFAALREMQRQVGKLQLDENGIARRGLLVRHLVLPGHIASTEAVFAFLAKEVSKQTYINIMDQYRPCYRAMANPPLDRELSAVEYEEALQLAEQYGLRRLDQRHSWRWLAR
jgi:putative pyruvate formate lyase activating enzyme